MCWLIYAPRVVNAYGYAFPLLHQDYNFGVAILFARLRSFRPISCKLTRPPAGPCCSRIGRASNRCTAREAFYASPARLKENSLCCVTMVIPPTCMVASILALTLQSELASQPYIKIASVCLIFPCSLSPNSNAHFKLTLRVRDGHCTDRMLDVERTRRGPSRPDGERW